MEPVGPNHPVTTTALVAAAREARRDQASPNSTASTDRPAPEITDSSAVPPADQARVALASLHEQVRRLERADKVAAVADAALGEITERLIEAEVIAVATTARQEARQEAREAERRELAKSRDDINEKARRAAFGGQPLLDGSLTIDVEPPVDLDEVSVPPIEPGEEGRATLAATRSIVTALRAELGAVSRDAVKPRLAAIEHELAQTASPAPLPEPAAALGHAVAARDQLLAGSGADAAAIAASSASNVLRLLA